MWLPHSKPRVTPRPIGIMSEVKYYEGSDVLNANCTMNFIVGNRSAGKSFFWKKYCVKQFLENNRRFIYIRRHKKDIDMSINSFFDDIVPKFPDWNYRRKGSKLYLYKINPDTDETVEEHVIGYAYALSESTKIKSIPCETVDTIFFDEFLPDNMQYLKPSMPLYEPEQLESIFLTVARGYKQVIRTEVKVICVSNATTAFSPYFSYYGIDLTGSRTYKKDGVFAQMYFNESVADEIVNAFDFGKTLARGTYGKHALYNESLRDSKTHIVKHTKYSIPIFYLYMLKWYVVYADFATDRLYCGEGYDETHKNKFYVGQHPFDDEIPMLSGPTLKMLKKYLQEDRVYYDSMKVKSALFGMFQPLLGRSK